MQLILEFNIYMKRKPFYSKEIALTGQLSATSWQLQSTQLSFITQDFPFSTLKTLGQRASHAPHPIHNSSFTTGFDINFL